MQHDLEKVYSKENMNFNFMAIEKLYLEEGNLEVDKETIFPFLS